MEASNSELEDARNEATLMYYFWQTQDKCPPDVIKSFTSDCPRQDCMVSFRIEKTTLAGTSDYYDKQGNLIINDKNRFTGKICCCKCWRGGPIDNIGNYTEINLFTEEYKLFKDKL